MVVTDAIDVERTMPLDVYLRALREERRGRGYVPLIVRAHLDDAIQGVIDKSSIDVVISKSVIENPRQPTLGRIIEQLLGNPEAYRGQSYRIDRPPLRYPMARTVPHNAYSDGVVRELRGVRSLRDISR